MTRKDYELIAEILRRAYVREVKIREENCWDGPNAVYSIAEDFADSLASTNPLFDRQRFLSACGVE